MAESLTSNLGEIFKDSGATHQHSEKNEGRSAAGKDSRERYPKGRRKYKKKPIETEQEAFIPGIVTAVKPQSKNAARVSVFIDEAFSFGCFKSVWQKNGVGKGEELDETKHAQLMNEESRCKLQHYWMDLLSRRNHSAGELRRKALQKGYPSHHFEALIDDFREKKFIDEHAYARRLAEEMRQRKRWGDRRIRAALLQKSIPEDIIDTVLVDSATDDELSDLKVLAAKNQRRLNREEDFTKRKKKLFDHLARKGHPPALIMKHIDDLMDHIGKDNS